MGKRFTDFSSTSSTTHILAGMTLECFNVNLHHVRQFLEFICSWLSHPTTDGLNDRTPVPNEQGFVQGLAES